MLKYSKISWWLHGTALKSVVLLSGHFDWGCIELQASQYYLSYTGYHVKETITCIFLFAATSVSFDQSLWNLFTICMSFPNPPVANAVQIQGPFLGCLPSIWEGPCVVVGKQVTQSKQILIYNSQHLRNGFFM